MTDHTEHLTAAVDYLDDQLGAIEIAMDAASRRMSEDLRIYTREWWGERCEDYEPDCACCKAWDIVDRFMKLNNFDAE